MRHDQDVKAVHGVDMQAERRQRELDNASSRRGGGIGGPSNGHMEDEDSLRHERELNSLDRNEREQVARKRHQVSSDL